VAWSTREIAEFAGTSVRTVRHYHQVGLLPEPERRPNGYKQYRVEHVVRVLRIRRLVELGFSLTRIAAMGDGDEHPVEALRAMDVELAAAVERLERARAELAVMLDRSVPTDLPTDLAEAAAGAALTAADRAYLVVIARVLGPRGRRVWVEVLRERPDHPAARDFDALADDADDATRQDVARGMADYHRRYHAAHPGLDALAVDAPRGARVVERTTALIMRDVYRPAQRDVLRRQRALLRG
jgi:DNA-binding transcriptional MerR regulator